MAWDGRWGGGSREGQGKDALPGHEEAKGLQPARARARQQVLQRSGTSTMGGGISVGGGTSVALCTVHPSRVQSDVVGPSPARSP